MTLNPDNQVVGKIQKEKYPAFTCVSSSSVPDVCAFDAFWRARLNKLRNDILVELEVISQVVTRALHGCRRAED